MMLKKFLMFAVIVVFINAQEKDVDLHLSGNLNLDSKIVFAEQQVEMGQEEVYNQNKKSPILAGLMSLVVPGAGEFYTGEYWKTALFMAVEAAAITVAIIYDGKGDDQTAFYENYADQNWSVLKYAQWTIDNATRINSLVNPDDYEVIKNGQVDWDELNALESAIGKWYSHRLAPYGDQQYYEMIGKYQQFNPGWDEFMDTEEDPYDYGDPLAEQFLYYSDQRGKANDFYNAARWGVIAVVTNHILSAVDAALSAGSYNRRLESQLNIRKQQVGFYSEYYPELSIRFSF